MIGTSFAERSNATVRRLLVAAGAVCAAQMAAVVGADATDLRQPAAAEPAVTGPAWTGAYVGQFAGYGWGRARATAPFDANTGFFFNWTGNPYSFSSDGFFGGATLGYNWQSGALVFGPEAEYGYLGLKGSAIDPNFRPGTVHIPDTETRFDSSFYAGAYARLGVTRGLALFYAKGGGAFLDALASTIDPCADGTPLCGTHTLAMTGSRFMAGWSVGGGLEWALAPHWSAKAEYAYFDFGRIRTAGTSSEPGEFFRQRIDVTAHTVKIGIHYLFRATPTVAERH